MSLFIPFNLQLKIFSFVKGIPANVVDKSQAIFHADTDLCSKLSIFLRFAAHYRPYMWLRYADNAIITSFTLISVHIRLLAIEMLNNPVLSLPFILKWERRTNNTMEQCRDMSKISAKILQLLPDTTTSHLET